MTKRSFPFLLGLLIPLGIRAHEAGPLEPHTETPRVSSPSALPVLGAHRTMAVLYQNCEALRVPPIPYTTEVKGIRTDPDPTQVHAVSTKVRFKEIEDAGALVASHPYLNKGEAKPGCLDLRKNPPIYDYGGTPAKEPIDHQISLHRDEGTGSKKVIGVDCSAFVTTSLLAAGLKLSARPVDLSPAQFDAFDSGQFLRAPVGKTDQPLGQMDCLSPVRLTPQGSVHAGDIVAIPGHVVMIDSVGSDPLGVGRATKPKECDTISAKDFDFVVVHSNAAYGGIGVAKSFGKDFFGERASTAGQELANMAREACRARFSSDPKGILLQSPKVGVVRHRSLIPGEDAPNCTTQPVSFAHQDCVRACWN